MSDVVPLRLPAPLAPVQGTLALALQPRQDPPPVPVLLRAADDDPGAAVAAWAWRFAQAALEIVGGDRPASQLARWCSAEVYADLHRRAWLVGGAGGHVPGSGRVQQVRPRVRSTRPCVLSPDVVEVAVHAVHGHRSRAVAARFEQRRGRWLCTALDFA